MSQNPFDALGGGGGLDLNALMQQAQQMQAQLEEAQDQLAEARVEGTVSGGAVTVPRTRSTSSHRRCRLALARKPCPPMNVQTAANRQLYPSCGRHTAWILANSSGVYSGISFARFFDPPGVR